MLKIQASTRRQHVREFTLLFVANTLVNLSTFAVFALSPRFLSIESFAALSLASSSCQILNAVLDLGLNTTALTKFSDRQDQRFLNTLISIKGGMFAAALLLTPVALLAGPMELYAFVLISGAAVNFWTAMRTVDQAQQNFRAYVAANMAFAMVRLLVGCAALLTGVWQSVMAGIFIAPVLCLVVIEFRRLKSRLTFPVMATVREMFAYSKLVAVSGLCFLLLPYLPQYVIFARLSALEVSTYGIVLVYIGPLSLLIFSLRSYLLPKVCADDKLMEGTAVLSWVILGGMAVALGLCGLSLVLGYLYAYRYPELPASFAVFSLCYVLTAFAGFFNMRLYPRGLVAYELAINAARLGISALLLFLWGHTLLEIVLLSSATMAAGELCLLFAVRRAVVPCASR
jgi:O-antigen/teichoic acid export membrane protein